MSPIRDVKQQLLALVCVLSCCGDVVAEYPPAVFLSDEHISQVQGKTAVLECEVHAHMQPVIRWTKSGREITSNLRKYSVEIFEDIEDFNDDMFAYICTLRVHDIKSHDFGNYTCTAVNNYGSDSKTLVLKEYTQDKSSDSSIYNEYKYKTRYDDYKEMVAAAASPLPSYCLLIAAVAAFLSLIVG